MSRRGRRLGMALLAALAGCDASVGENDVGAIVPRAQSRLALDGAMDPLYMSSPEHALTKVVRGAPPEPADLSATWRALHDETCLYLLITVTDDMVMPSTHLEEGWWDDDAIEVFVDGDGSGGEFYDNFNDAQLAFRHDLNIIETGDATLAEAIKIDEIPVHTQPSAAGYTMEIAIPWTSINTPFREGMIIGFDVEVNDRDERPGREGKLGWAAQHDKAWTNPYLFGRVQLGL